MTATIENSAVSIEDEPIGTASLRINGRGTADPQAVRLFMGVQGNILVLRGLFVVIALKQIVLRRTVTTAAALVAHVGNAVDPCRIASIALLVELPAGG